jgi:hypothetical protein
VSARGITPKGTILEPDNESAARDDQGDDTLRLRELTVAKKQQHVRKASRLPADYKIEELLRSLAAYNERIAELESEGHKGHAMKILKAMVLDLARQIDELRGLLARK